MHCSAEAALMNFNKDIHKILIKISTYGIGI